MLLLTVRLLHRHPLHLRHHHLLPRDLVLDPRQVPGHAGHVEGLRRPVEVVLLVTPLNIHLVQLENHLSLSLLGLQLVVINL